MSGTGFRHFRVREPTGRFAMGSGLVSADLNRLAVKLDDPDAPVVIRYLWTSGLEADGVATLFPHDMGSGVNFIGIKPNGQRDVIIRFTRWL